MIALALALTLATAPEAAPDTLRKIVPIPGIEVSTARAGDRAPLSRSRLSRDQIGLLNWGQDTPMALATLPGVYAYSDAGNGVGYSYLSIRGFPQRRISVLVNGVPLNDPESHEVYWIDHPDLLASTQEVELQRGVGSALYGAASLGGSVNLETAPFSDAPHSAASLSYGSWETKRLMLEMNSGRLDGGWNYYGRYSRIESFGYRDQSGSTLWSYAFSARKLAGQQSFRVNLYGGPEETHLAYLGVPAEYLDGLVTGNRDRDRRFNPLTYASERDHFFEPHYELIHSWSPSQGLSFSQTLFWFDGRGYYDEQRLGQNLSDYRLAPWSTSDSTLFPRTDYRQDAGGNLVRDSLGRVTVERFDVVRRRSIIDRHFGWVPRLKWDHAGGALTLGGELRAHDGRHFGEVISGDGITPSTEPDHHYYDYHPRTLAAGLFAREEWRLAPPLLVTADLAWRHEGYFLRGDHFDGVRFDQLYDFGLPRLGLSYAPRPNLDLFASFAYSEREPALRDLYDGEGVGGAPLLNSGQPLIRPEKVNDFELGGHWRGHGVTASVDLFRMNFRDELVDAGQFNTDLGYPILGNAARSVHQGVELATSAERSLESGMHLALDANATLGDNHFVEYREVDGPTPADVVKFDGNKLGFFPAVIENLAARASWRGALLGIDAQHVGRIYLDNHQNMLASIGPHNVLDATGGFRVGVRGSQLEAQLRVFNALDTHYAASGYMDYDASGNLVPQFMPAATRHWLASVRVEF